MKTNPLIRKFYLILIVTFFSCSEDLDKPIIYLDQNESIVKTLNYNELPFDIKNLVTQNFKNLKEASKTKKSNSEFGNIGNLAVVDNSIDDKTIYTIQLESVLDGFYYDNILATKQLDGKFIMNTIRYTPDLDWYIETLGNENKYETYSGSIEVFNNQAESVFQSYFTNGEAIGAESKSSNLTSRCIITKIESYGFVYNGRSHVEGVNIWVKGCGGNDTSFLNGSDSSTGNQSTSSSSGGGSIRTSPISEESAIEQDVNANKLCGNYKWQTIGSSHTVNLVGLGATFVNYRFQKAINFDFANVCVSIPEYNFKDGIKHEITRDMASTSFNLAWIAAINRTLRQINNNTTYNEVKSKIFNNLQLQLSESVPGSSITRGVCKGTLNTSIAKYCL
jgi:hypothetical protein